MEEINQRKVELKVSEQDWFSIWMLGRMNKRKRMEYFQYQAMRAVVKERNRERFSMTGRRMGQRSETD